MTNLTLKYIGSTETVLVVTPVVGCGGDESPATALIGPIEVNTNELVVLDGQGSLLSTCGTIELYRSDSYDTGYIDVSCAVDLYRGLVVRRHQQHQQRPYAQG